MSPRRQAVILAGGLATRLGSASESLPKFLVPVAGRPFAAWVLDQLHAAGFDEVVLCIGHLGDAIEQALGDGSRFGLQLRYSEDGPVLLGTGGALRKAAPLLQPTFLLTYGDSFLPFDYRSPLSDLEAHPEALGTLAVYRNDNQLDRSNVREADGLVTEYRKVPADQPAVPNLRDIDYGAMALRRQAVERIEPGQAYGLGELQAALAQAGQLRALRVPRRFYEIGSPEGLAALDRELTEHSDDYPNRSTPS